MKPLRAIPLVVLCLFGSAPILFAQTQQPTNAQQTGEITGLADYCGAAGNAALTVFIPGESSQARVLSTGKFTLRFVPAGTYSLVFEIPGQLTYSRTVSVASNKITNLGTVPICRDADGDGSAEDADCNDSNPNIKPGAPELCDGFDNNCDGLVDDAGCQTCTDADIDGFFAQAGCSTPVDCDDGDAQTRPGATELCDAVDNNCDGTTNEGFDFNTDGANCGACGNVCSFANATAVCSGGACLQSTCDQGFLDCDGSSANGCEVSGTTCPNANGESCTADGDCVSGSCVDGVCCNTSCNGTCAACDLTGSLGSCSFLPAGTDPDSECGTVSCWQFYYGWLGDTCFRKADVSAEQATCGGDGACYSAAEACSITSVPGSATVTCHSLCQEPNRGSCSGTAAGYCTNVNPGNQTCGQGACERTAPSCWNGVPQACVPGEPTAERCGDGIDNDCDGAIDEGCGGE